MKNIFWQFVRRWTPKFFVRKRLPLVSDRSSLAEVAAHYPDFIPFLECRYRISVAASDLSSSLQAFVARHRLPPARIVFMESQLAERMQTIATLGPEEAYRLLGEEPGLQIIDVREAWEWKAGSLPGARPLDPTCWREITDRWARETPVLVYCHFGVRSLDAALALSAHGFKRVFTLNGGIDAWSQHVDPTIPRYTGSYC